MGCTVISGPKINRSTVIEIYDEKEAIAHRNQISVVNVRSKGKNIRIYFKEILPPQTQESLNI